MRLVHTLSILLTALNASLPAVSSSPELPPDYSVTAHRGVVGEGILENSLDSLNLTIDRGYTHVEVDVRTTKDGVLVCHHDPTLRRELGIDKAVADLTLEELRAVATEAQVPTLAAFAEKARGRIGLMVDVKGFPKELKETVVAQIREALESNSLMESALFIGRFDVGMAFAGEARVAWRGTLEATRKRLAEDPEGTKKYFIFNHGDDFTRENVAAFQELGLKVIVSINTQHYRSGDPIAQGRAHIQAMLDYGVDGLQIDSVYDDLLFGTQEPVAQESPLKLAALFTDHMVVQRDMPVPVYGHAAPGASVSATFAGEHRTTQADNQGAWRMEFPAMDAGGSYTLEVASGTIQVVLENVVAGDVWLCSGQSNMVWPVNTGVLRVANADAETAAANWPDIRLLTVGAHASDDVQSSIQTLGWRVCSPESVGSFSGVGYFFGRELHQHLDVPIGLLLSAAGGTIVEAWTSQEGLETVPEMADLLREYRDNASVIKRISEDYDRNFDAWYQEIAKEDPGYENGRPVWSDPGYDPASWPTMSLPVYWEEAGYPDFDGVMWFRRDAELPEAWAGHDLWLKLAAVNDRVRIWFNGEEIVGWAGNAQAEAGFPVSGRLVRAGRNTIAVRVFDMGGNGGIYANANDMWLGPGGGDTLPLAGEWRFRIGFRMPSGYPKMPRPPAVHPENPNMPSRLYNGMIAPLLQTPIRGVIWYQGEGNSRRSHQYRALFPALIRDWRKQWGQGDFPFLFVQLANFNGRDRNANLGWAELREAQAMALDLPSTGMAVTIDIGEADDVHPKNKQDVGRRLALAARHVAYGEDLVYSGPMYQSHAIEEGGIRIRFSHAGGGLKTSGMGELKGFEIAGADRDYRRARARIDGDSVVVWSDAVTDPVAARYAWDGDPQCNLYNEEGLPASPFRTEDWPGVTVGQLLALPEVGP